MSQAEVEADQAFIRRIDAAIDSGVPSLYANGFANALGSGDIVTVFEQNGRPVATLNLSFTVAKTFALALGNLVSQLEAATGRTMLTTFEIDGRLSSGANPLTDLEQNQ